MRWNMQAKMWDEHQQTTQKISKNVSLNYHVGVKRNITAFLCAFYSCCNYPTLSLYIFASVVPNSSLCKRDMVPSGCSECSGDLKLSWPIEKVQDGCSLNVDWFDENHNSLLERNSNTSWRDVKGSWLFSEESGKNIENPGFFHSSKALSDFLDSKGIGKGDAQG